MPILPWQNTKLLSVMVGDTVYAASAFDTALRFMRQLGVPCTRGSIGVEIPGANPEAWGSPADDVGMVDVAPEMAGALRAIVELPDILNHPKSFTQLLGILREAKWDGIEIRTDAPLLPGELKTLVKDIERENLQPILNLDATAWRGENRDIIDRFHTIALVLTTLAELPPTVPRFLGVHEVIALVIDARSPQRTNLEKALSILVTLRAGLDVDTAVSVGIAGGFADESVEPKSFAMEIVEEIQLADARQKLLEVLDLSSAFHHGKESASFAFAADQIARAARLTSQSAISLPAADALF